MFRLKNNPVLTSYQTKILKTFFASKLGQQFFLTGGTALAAFYLGHRQSKDLDFFTLKPFDSLELEKLIKKIARETSSKVKTSDYYEVYLENKKEGWIQRLDFVKEQPVVFGKRKTIDDITIDSLKNIASNEILTIYGRLEPKDYLDLYFIFKETNLDFDKLFEKTKQKDTSLHEFYFANLIAEAGQPRHFPKTLKPFDKRELVSFYLQLSEKLFKKIKPNSGLGLIGILLIIGILLLTAGGVVGLPAVRQVWEKKVKPTPISKNGCIVGGCNGELCLDEDSEGVDTICRWLPQYECFRTATCERQTDGRCGWTQTKELIDCLNKFKN